MDETYIKVKGEWVYYYRAVDKEGKTIDFFLSRILILLFSLFLWFFGCPFRNFFYYTFNSRRLATEQSC
jgi:hypothetical protein